MRAQGEIGTASRGGGSSPAGGTWDVPNTVSDSDPYSTGSICEAQPRAHLRVWLDECAQVCAWRG